MFFDKKIWINWRMEQTDKGKPTKVPYQTNGRKASTTDPTTWTTYIEAIKTSENVGIVFEPSVGIIGIDFDHCIENGKIKIDSISNFLDIANTYIEYSPSKTGLHILFQCLDPFTISRNKQQLGDGVSVEIYREGRYFTYTSDPYTLCANDIRTISADDFISLIKTLGYPWGEKESPSVSGTLSTCKSLDLDDNQLLQKMFGSKNGSNIEKLYNGDTSKYQGDESSADSSLCSHLAFWTQKDHNRIERMWLASPLGAREKTQKRADYRKRTIENAIKITNDVYTPTILNLEDEKGEYITDKAGKPLLIMENICRILVNDKNLQDRFRLNDFSHMTETNWDKTEWVNLYDGAIYEVQRYIQSNYPLFNKVVKSMVTDAILSVAYRNKVNPPRDYFVSLVWDKKPRLDSWLPIVYGVEDNEIYQAIGSNWIKGLVKRVMSPGCIFDEVLALEGKQGWRKSTSIRELGTPWHVETTHSMDDKDFYMILAQNIIVEFSEGDIFDRNSMKKIKAEVTKTEDQYRPPYERGMMTYKRSCVFAVTTNKLELKDDTGNRRWLPVQLEKIADVDWIRENRDQLFAEAYFRAIVNGEDSYQYPEGLEELQESRNEQNDNDEKLLYWYSGLSEKQREEGVTLTECMAELYGVSIKRDRLMELTTSSILKRTLKLENKVTRKQGASVRRWCPTEKTEKIINEIIKENNENIF